MNTIYTDAIISTTDLPIRRSSTHSLAHSTSTGSVHSNSSGIHARLLQKSAKPKRNVTASSLAAKIRHAVAGPDRLNIKKRANATEADKVAMQMTFDDVKLKTGTDAAYTLLDKMLDMECFGPVLSTTVLDSKRSAQKMGLEVLALCFKDVKKDEHQFNLIMKLIGKLGDLRSSYVLAHSAQARGIKTLDIMIRNCQDNGKLDPVQIMQLKNKYSEVRKNLSMAISDTKARPVPEGTTSDNYRPSVERDMADDMMRELTGWTRPVGQ